MTTRKSLEARRTSNVEKWIEVNGDVLLIFTVAAMQDGSKTIVLFADGADKPFLCFPLPLAKRIAAELRICEKLAEYEAEAAGRP